MDSIMAFDMGLSVTTSSSDFPLPLLAGITMMVGVDAEFCMSKAAALADFWLAPPCGAGTFSSNSEYAFWARYRAREGSGLYFGPLEQAVPASNRHEKRIKDVFFIYITKLF